MDDYLKYQKWNISATTGQIFPKFYTCMTKAKFTNVSNEDDFQWKWTSDGILPQISKVKYLSNNWSDLPQILNLSLCDQTELNKCFNWRQPSSLTEDDLKILKVKYLSNHWSDLTQILKVSLREQINYKNVSNEDALVWKMTSNIEGEISQQPQVGSCPNFKLKLMWPNQTIKMITMKKNSNARQPLILKVKYLRNHWSDLPEILNLSLFE